MIIMVCIATVVSITTVYNNRGFFQHLSRKGSNVLSRLAITRSAATNRPLINSPLLIPESPSAYDKWYRSQVAQSLEEADSPEAEWFSTDQVFAEIDRDLEELTGGHPG